MARYPQPLVALARRTVWRLSRPLVEQTVAEESTRDRERSEGLEGRIDALVRDVARVESRLEAVSHENEVLRKEIIATNHRLSWFEGQAERATRPV